MQIVSVRVDGARRYTAAEVVKSSGISPGATVTSADLAEALERMAGTGLFKQVNYRYVGAGAGKTTVILEIEEAEWTMPVEFDNFVWFTDEELAQALRENVFSFDGKVPANAGVPELVSAELQKLLKARSLSGVVEFVPQGDLKMGISRYLFRVKDGDLKICTLEFSGTAAIKGDDLSSRLGIVGTEYSRSFLTKASRGTLTDMYRQRGRWHASVGAPSASVAQGGGCSGVRVAVNVDEGPEYAWNPTIWNGQSALAAGELDRLMGLKVGEVASVTRLDDGLRNVAAAYRKQGYLQHTASYEPRLDDGSRRIAPAIQVTEGPQFRMGTLEFSGLSPADAAFLAKRWKLQPNDVFDGSYPSQYIVEEIRPRLKTGNLPAERIELDDTKRIVNVKLIFGQ